jgi:hypothetical protein
VNVFGILQEDFSVVDGVRRFYTYFWMSMEDTCGGGIAICG